MRSLKRLADVFIAGLATLALAGLPSGFVLPAIAAFALEEIGRVTNCESSESEAARSSRWFERPFARDIALSNGKMGWCFVFIDSKVQLAFENTVTIERGRVIPRFGSARQPM
jgi:hypothetical protein